jgi:hypothetical protein
MPTANENNGQIAQPPQATRRCPNCDLPLRLLQTFPDIRSKKSIRVLQCSNCAMLVWDD